MLMDTVFIGFSGALLAYWFRYACVLILSARATRDYASAVVTANALEYPEIQRRLAEGPAEEVASLDGFYRAIDRDYRLLTCLMRHGAGSRRHGCLVESRMLMLYYRLMGACYAICRRISLRRGRRALEEMASILRHFADTIGQCAAAAQ